MKKVLMVFVFLVTAFVYENVAASEKPEIFPQLGHSSGIVSIAFAPDGRTVASGSTDKTVKLWDVASGRELRTLSGHTEWVTSVAFAPDGRTVASGSPDKTVKLWDVASGSQCYVPHSLPPDRRSSYLNPALRASESLLSLSSSYVSADTGVVAHRTKNLTVKQASGLRHLGNGMKSLMACYLAMGQGTNLFRAEEFYREFLRHKSGTRPECELPVVV